MYPVLFEIAGRPVFAFGTFLALGFFLAYLYAGWRCGQKGVSDTHVLNIFIILIVFGVAGGRILAVMINPALFTNWKSVFAVSDGGLAFHGGLISALAGGIGYMIWQGIPIMSTLDCFGPAVPLAHASGRIGCFLFGCCFGIECDLPWALKMPPAGPAGEWVYRHPTQLYEFALLLILAYVLHRFIDRPHTPGLVFVGYGYGYAMIRFPLEMIRADHFIEPHYFGLSVGQVACLAMATVAGVVHWLLIRNRKPVKPSRSPTGEAAGA